MDAHPKARAGTAVVVELAAIERWSTLAQPCHVGPALFILSNPFILFTLLAHYCGFHGSILIVETSIVWLHQQVTECSVDGVAATIVLLAVHHLCQIFLLSLSFNLD